MQRTDPSPHLQHSTLLVSASKHNHKVSKEPLAVFTDERSVEVKVEEGHMKEEGKVRGPVSIVELKHQL